MPHISELKESKYLSKEDCGPGILVTIKGCYQANVAMESQPQELKWILSFVEPYKPMVLNPTNAQLIAQALSLEHTDQWVGKRIVLFNDKTVAFQGKLTGGIRARAPRQAAAAVPGVPVAQPVPGAVHAPPVAAYAPPPEPVPGPGAEQDEVTF